MVGHWFVSSDDSHCLAHWGDLTADACSSHGEPQSTLSSSTEAPKPSYHSHRKKEGIQSTLGYQEGGGLDDYVQNHAYQN